jgi:hypothetical protein
MDYVNNCPRQSTGQGGQRASLAGAVADRLGQTRDRNPAGNNPERLRTNSRRTNENELAKRK